MAELSWSQEARIQSRCPVRAAETQVLEPLCAAFPGCTVTGSRVGAGEPGLKSSSLIWDVGCVLCQMPAPVYISLKEPLPFHLPVIVQCISMWHVAFFCTFSKNESR